jgi:hypothetical protein
MAIVLEKEKEKIMKIAIIIIHVTNLMFVTVTIVITIKIITTIITITIIITIIVTIIITITIIVIETIIILFIESIPAFIVILTLKEKQGGELPNT